MKGQTIVALQKETHAIVPISAVTLTGERCGCICHDCKTELEAVINTSRKKHFRHHSKKDCNPSPESELHLLAKKIILDHRKMNIPVLGWCEYTDPVCETFYNDLIPDATVQMNGQPLYIEVVVSNPISEGKYYKYKADNLRVLVIDLQAQDPLLSYEQLEKLILAETENKEMLGYFSGLSVMPKTDASGSDLFWALLGIGAAAIIHHQLTKKKPARRIYRRYY